MDTNKEIGFIARHYKEEVFSVETALRKIKPNYKTWRTLPKIAAASLILVVLSGTAAIVLLKYSPSDTTKKVSLPIQEYEDSKSISRVIDFNDVPLTTVTDQIELIYGVEITGLPENAEEYYLTLHYEGSVVELIESINEILGTTLRIKE